MRGKKNSNPFLLKEITIHHHLCAHKVGFDGVLLGAWANFNDSHFPDRQINTILDIGTGSGLLALMAEKKNQNASITAIEIDEKSSKQALQNFENSRWKERLKLIHADFLDYNFSTKFDHIVTNPPYFLNALPTPEERRTNARHFSLKEFENFIQKATSILADSGQLSMIVPTQNHETVLSILNKKNFYKSRICHVFTKSHDISERILITVSLAQCNVEENKLFVYDSIGKYSAEYIKLTNDFYPNF
jgi:tRNA1Val (adenine37-N6)-methyltransferase